MFELSLTEFAIIVAAIATLTPLVLIIVACVRKAWLAAGIAGLALGPVAGGIGLGIYVSMMYPESPNDITEAFNQFVSYGFFGLLTICCFVLAGAFIVWAIIAIVLHKPASARPVVPGGNPYLWSRGPLSVHPVSAPC